MEYQRQVISPKINIGSDYIFLGSEHLAYSRACICTYAMIYPLKKIEFENEEFWAPADSEEHLKRVFGDIYQFPNFKVLGHSNIVHNSFGDYEMFYRELISIFQSFTSQN